MKKIFLISIVLSILALSEAYAGAGGEFPRGPELAITPGKLCDRPNSFRYQESVAYCERDVTFETKEEVIREYDQQFGYTIAKMPRADFKIDHLIPLCAGGSNEIVNLWPQHKTIYAITDPLEPAVCLKMSQGRLRQADAVQLIIEGKSNLSLTSEIVQYLNGI